MREPVWTRDGHLLDLALYRILLGEDLGEGSEHLATCAHCQQRLARHRCQVALAMDVFRLLWPAPGRGTP